MINIAIIEDEKKERDIENEFFIKLKNELNIPLNLAFFENGESFLFDFSYGKYELIILDIDLKSDKNGIDTAIKLRTIDKDAKIIFITNLAQFAIDGYKVNATDYIVKPFNYEIFKNRMSIILEKLFSQKAEKILIQANGTKIVLQIKDIFYIEVLNHKTIFHTSKGNFTTYSALKKIEEELKDFNFAQCNSCFLINLEYVENVEGFNVFVHGEELAISHPKKKEFMNKINIFLGK